jgi:AraC-like DNA-binding protein
LAWVTFRSTAVRAFNWRRDFWDGAAPLAAIAAVFTQSDSLDIVVTVAFLGYGAAILLALRGGADSLPLTRLEAGHGPGLVWGGIAIGLIVSAISDVLIVAAMATGRETWRPIIISVFSALTLGLFGALVMSQSLAGGGEPETTAPPLAPIDEAKTGEIMARLEALMASERLFLNPDLTLERLARRLLVPAKQLSIAINRATGENVSRYVNRLRIDHACSGLLEGRNVTEVMLSSGFNTKSNFNREFLRLKGTPPSQWLALHKSATLV